ncbi:MAG: ATP-binding protein [Acidimicrobiales bacterium]
MRIQVSLCLPRDAKTVALVRSVTMAALDKLGITAECVDDIRLALSEACTNVIQHAAETEEYEVRVELTDDLCRLSVIDAGHGLDASALAPRMPDPSSHRGRGVALMAALTDGASFSSQPSTGTVVHLVKSLRLDATSPMSELLPK